MTRYLIAVLAAATFAFTGQPSGLRLLTALALANGTLWIWGCLSNAEEEVTA